MSQSRTIVTWNEDGSATALARLVARNGSGAAITGEGRWIKQADVSTITCTVYEDGTSIATPTVTVADSIIDSPVTDGVIWDRDAVGYNFLHDLAYTCFPVGGKRYRVEYYAVLTGGARFGWAYEGIATSRSAG